MKMNYNSSHLKISMQTLQHDYSYLARQLKPSRRIYAISSSHSWRMSSFRNQGRTREFGRLCGIGYLIGLWQRKWTSSRILRMIGLSGTVNCYNNFYRRV